MSTTAVGPLSQPLAIVADAIATLSAWAAWVHVAAPAADPVAQVYLGEAPVGHPSPAALVDWDNGLAWSATDVADSAEFQADGQILVGLRWRVPAGMTDRDARITFDNAVGAVLAALRPAIVPPLRAIGWSYVSANLVSGPDRTSIPERQGGQDWMEAVWSLAVRGWGGPA